MQINLKLMLYSYLFSQVRQRDGLLQPRYRPHPVHAVQGLRVSPDGLELGPSALRRTECQELVVSRTLSFCERSEVDRGKKKQISLCLKNPIKNYFGNALTHWADELEVLSNFRRNVILFPENCSRIWAYCTVRLNIWVYFAS